MLHMDKTLSPPTKPPRVSVPVTEEVLQVFQRLAAASGMSTGKAMAEWLTDTVEAAEYMAQTLERARAAPKVVMREMHAYQGDMTAVWEKIIGDHHSQALLETGVLLVDHD